MVNSIFTNRRAVRNFSSESISDDEIKSLIAAFQTTPCGMHQTDVMSLVVVKDEALRDKIETKTDNACYHAPVLFIINTKKDSMFGERDASCGAENIMLEAARLNDDSELQKELGIDPAFQTSVIVPVGKIGEKPEATDRSNRYQVTIY